MEQTLDLRRNRIGDGGALSIAKALQRNTKLRKLWLDDNAIGDEGAKALASGLRQNRALSELSCGALVSYLALNYQMPKQVSRRSVQVRDEDQRFAT